MKMNKLKQALLPLKKIKNKFILHLNKNVYKDEIVKRAVSEDKDWIKEMPSTDKGYARLELRTSDAKDVLNWFNYLIYLHKG